MSAFEEISLDEITKLREPEPSVVVDQAPEVPTFDCEYCGHCENPNNCVWGVICPVCEVGPREQCIEPFDKRVVGLHAERWQLATKK